LLGGAMADVLATVEAFTAILAEEQPESQG
jgi:hypothetical protein